MDKNLVLKIVISISITGIIILFIISKFITIEPIKIISVDDKFIGKTVLINGTITKVSSSNRTVLYVDNSTIPFIIFSKVEILKNSGVLITGRVDEYKDGLQILVDKIEIVR